MASVFDTKVIDSIQKVKDIGRLLGNNYNEIRNKLNWIMNVVSRNILTLSLLFENFS